MDYEPQEGIWTLTAPDGRQWNGASGLLAAAAEQRDRIPPEVQLERLMCWDEQPDVEQLESDCMTLALRLFGENPDTFAPETREVMDRWRPKCRALFNSEAMAVASAVKAWARTDA